MLVEVLELLEEPVSVLLAVMDLLGWGERVDTVDGLEELEGDTVPVFILLLAVVGVRLVAPVEDRVNIGLGVMLRLWGWDGELLLVVDGEPVAVWLNETLIDAVIVLVPIGEPVIFVVCVALAVLVEVFDADTVRVVVREVRTVRLSWGESVVVLETIAVTEPVGLTVLVLLIGADRVAVGEPVLVFDVVIDDVPVLLIKLVPVNLVDFENEAEAETVFELAVVRLTVPLDVAVLERAVDLLCVVDDDGDFDVELDAVMVLDDVIVFVAVAVPVWVFVCMPLKVGCGEEEEDFDEVVVLVDVMLLVMLLVDVGDGLTAFVGAADLLRVVVFVDVFDSVAVAVGTTFNIRLLCSINISCCENIPSNSAKPRRILILLLDTKLFLKYQF